MKQSQGNYYVTVLEDTRTNEIIGNATLLVEQKFIHSCGLVSNLGMTYLYGFLWLCGFIY